MYTLLVANAPDVDIAIPPFDTLPDRADLVVAVDGGGNPLFAAGVRPDVVIGDLDSLAQDALEYYTQAGVEIVRYPAEKDETDIELALLLAVERGATHIDVLGALGGRWDQSLSNIALLALPELAGCFVRLLEPSQELYLVRGEATVTGNRGDTVSLLPVWGAASGITIRGFYYPLHDATLHPERSRGVSNVLLDPPGHVQVREGLLLVVHHSCAPV